MKELHYCIRFESKEKLEEVAQKAWQKLPSVHFKKIKYARVEPAELVFNEGTDPAWSIVFYIHERSKKDFARKALQLHCVWPFALNQVLREEGYVK